MAAFVHRANWFGWGSYAAPARTAAGTVVGASVTLPFNEPLTANAPTAVQFLVQVAGVQRTVNSAAAAGSAVTLTLATPVTTGQAVTVSYSPTGAVKVLDAAGNPAAGWTDAAVVNNT